MHLGNVQYGRVQTSLVGFGGSIVRPIGSIPLQVSMGAFPTRVTETILFVVVDNTFDYNVILGRPGLNQFRAVASPLHNRVKFPTPNGVGEEVGNVREAWECYIMSTKGATLPVLSIIKRPRSPPPVALTPLKEEIGVGSLKEKFPKTARIEPHEALKEVQLIERDSGKVTRIGT